MKEELQPYLAALRELPFVKGVALEAVHARRGGVTDDAVVRLRTKKGWRPFAVELKRTPNRVVLERLLAHRPKTEFLLFAPYLTPPLAEQLVARGGNFLDLAGNCHLAIDGDYLVHVEGRRPRRAEGRGRGFGAAGYQVLFALLARPDLLRATIRDLAAAAGVGKTVAAEALQRLDEQGWLARRARGGPILLRPAPALLERWLTGYADILRPKLLLGRYRGPNLDPLQLEKRIEEALGDELRWCFGGGAAAYRLTKHYRGDTTVLHLDRPLADVGRRLGMLPAEDGPLQVLRAPGPMAFEGPLPRVAHPLLVYTELLVAGGERERETAAQVGERYLGELH